MLLIFPLDSYPWCSRYAWVQDKFGMTWQLDVDDIRSTQKILPCLLFVNVKADKVQPAMDFYTSVFPESRVILTVPHDASSGMPEGSLLFAQYRINGYLVNSMSSTMHHDYDFNEAVSLMVHCQTQEEMDFYWEKLSEGGEEQPCGWLKDRSGVSCQVVPVEMDEMMLTAGKDQLDRVMQVMMPMMKLDVKALREAFHGHSWSFMVIHCHSWSFMVIRLYVVRLSASLLSGCHGLPCGPCPVLCALCPVPCAFLPSVNHKTPRTAPFPRQGCETAGCPAGRR